MNREDCSVAQVSASGDVAKFWTLSEARSCLGAENAKLVFTRGADEAAGVGSSGISNFFVDYYNSYNQQKGEHIEKRSLAFPAFDSGAGPVIDTRVKGVLPPLSSRSGAKSALFATATSALAVTLTAIYAF